MSYILAIDQGTSSTKVIAVDKSGKVVAKGSRQIKTNFLPEGFVEQDPEELFDCTLSAIQKCLAALEENGSQRQEIKVVGVTNQRETFILWDKNGKALHPAIVWQCKRSIDICERLKAEGKEDMIKEKTGLLIDPYFSATKLIWLLENKPEIKQSIENGEVFFGTVDTWLLYRLTEGRIYATDPSNASRTLMFNIRTLTWDMELIDAFGLSGLNLPEVKMSASDYGRSNLNGLLKNPVPISAVMGDSQAALYGEGCFEAGMTKVTLGTGSSVLMNIGPELVLSQNGMVTSVGWNTKDEIVYVLEGVIVSCGSTLEWLKNQLGILAAVQDSSGMALSVPDNGGVYLIPAFSGLGSPYWEMNRKGSIHGLTFETNKNNIVRAALESIPYQIRDVINAMEKDAGLTLKKIRVNGGLTSNEFVMKFLASVLAIAIEKSDTPDISALGVAMMAGGLVQTSNGKRYNGDQDIIEISTNGKQVDKAGKCYKRWARFIRIYSER